MAITRTPIHDDDGTGTTGTIIDNAWKQEFYDQIDGLRAARAATGSMIAPVAGGTIALSAGYGAHIVLLQSGERCDHADHLFRRQRREWRTVSFKFRAFGVGDHRPFGGRMLNIATSAPTPLGSYGAASVSRYAGGSGSLTCARTGQSDHAAISSPRISPAAVPMTWTVAKRPAGVRLQTARADPDPEFLIQRTHRRDRLDIFCRSATVPGAASPAIRRYRGLRSAPFVFDGGGAFVPAVVIGLIIWSHHAHRRA